MEDDKVNIIRESSRNLLTIGRRGCREKEFDNRRSALETQSFTKEKVLEIANKLKTRGSIQIETLSYLKNSFSEDKQFIETFLSVQGALTGLIRELTGASGEKQVCACACVCNLCAWEWRGSGKVSKVATAYLHTALRSYNHELQVTSAWCLGNISAMCGTERLQALGSHATLLDMAEQDDVQLRDAALYATLHIVKAEGDNAHKDYIKKCIKVVTARELTIQSSQLLFYLSCHKHFIKVVDSNFIENLVKQLCIYIEKHNINCLETNQYVCCECIYILKVLANVCQESVSSEIVLQMLLSNNCVELIKSISKYSRTEEYCLWLLGNIYNFTVESDSKVLFFNNLIQ